MQFSRGLIFTAPKTLLSIRFCVGVVTPAVRFFSSNESAGRVLLHASRARQSIMQSMLMQRNAVTIRGGRPADLVTQMLAMEELTWAATGPGERK